MPNLQNLKKQAKQLVRWHKDRNHSVAARIRAVLPEYADWTDQDILKIPFPLSAAQRLLAIEQGFESWAALTERLETMNNSQLHDAAATQMLSVNPLLFVKDVALAASYYKRYLGFEITFLHGDPAFYAEVRRDNVSLNLRAVCETVIEQALREKEILLSAYVDVVDVKALYLEFQSLGVEFLQALKIQPWQSKDFIVKDPDGNLLCFAQQIEPN